MYNCKAIHEVRPFVSKPKYSFATVLGIFYVAKRCLHREFTIVNTEPLTLLYGGTKDGMEFIVFCK